MRTPRLTLHMAATALSLAGCLEIPAPGSPGPHELCIKTDWIDPVEVPGCLGQAHLIDAVDESTAVALVSATIQLRDSLLGDPAASSSGKAAELTRALSHLSQYYARDLFADTARFHRMLDHVAVTGEYVRGKVLWVGGRAWPIATPWLSWAYYFDVGIFFHVVNTVHAVVYPIPQPSVPDDSVLSIAEQIYQYALWRHHGPTRFPVWEYQFTWNSGGVQVRAPWISGLGQAHALMLFGECFRRSHDVVWMQRGAEVLGSFMTLWDDGGTLLPDTTHGYWWEEFHPAVRVFNGAA
ncbi:MAG TPA: D-glucuronyl C5-epimerase family protein, partial [Gemmatimonadales bacterium]